MKFLSPEAGSTYQLPEDLLSQGSQLELLHISSAQPGPFRSHQALFASNLDPLEILQKMVDQNLTSILQSPPEDFTQDVRGWIQLRESSRLYFEEPIRCLMPQAEGIERHRIQARLQKEKLRESVRVFGEKNGNGACQESLQVVFEELYMNAMIDAPREKDGSSHEHEISLWLGYDSRRVAIACEDYMGSLKMEKLLGRMKEVYEKGAGEAINLSGIGGAGLGCTMMVEKSSLVCFGVQPGRKTVVTCLIPRHLSRRKSSEIKKSLHCLVDAV